jgi:hypothetical protein
MSRLNSEIVFLYPDSLEIVARGEKVAGVEAKCRRAPDALLDPGWRPDA